VRLYRLPGADGSRRRLTVLSRMTDLFNVVYRRECAAHSLSRGWLTKSLSQSMNQTKAHLRSGGDCPSHSEYDWLEPQIAMRGCLWPTLRRAKGPATWVGLTASCGPVYSGGGSQRRGSNAPTLPPTAGHGTTHQARRRPVLLKLREGARNGSRFGRVWAPPSRMPAGTRSTVRRLRWS